MKTPVVMLFLFLAYLAALFSFLTLLVVVILGQAPYHCRYLVPTGSRPVVYHCSAYPTAKP